MCTFREQPNEEVDIKTLALRAVKCGLEIQKNFAVYDSGEGFTLTLHIGIGVGNVSLLFVGGVNNQWMYIITGEALSQLATCVDASKSGEVVISKQCKMLIDNEVECHPVKKDFIVTNVFDHVQLSECELIEPKVPIAAEGALRSFVHPAVLARLQSNEFQLDELRTITSIFIKLICDNFDDNEQEFYCSSIHEAFCCIQEQVVKREGMICQFLQDDKGIILFAAFGVPPNSHSDDPIRAVKTSIDIREKLLELGVRCAIGISTGFVFTGVVGPETRHDYTVLGDTVNMSARLMAKAYELDVGILVAQSTYESCNLRLKFNEYEPVLVKGKDTPINIYSPELSKDSLEDNNTPTFQPTAFNIIGRDEEKFLLTRYVVELREHYSLGISLFHGSRPDQLARTIIIEGPAGSGKSFLSKFSSRVASQIGIFYFSFFLFYFLFFIFYFLFFIFLFFLFLFFEIPFFFHIFSIFFFFFQAYFFHNF